MIYILAPIGWKESDNKVEKLLALKEEGFGRLLCGGKPMRLDNLLQDVNTYINDDVYILIDRLQTSRDLENGLGISDDELTRIQDSVQTAFNSGDGRMSVYSESNEQVVYRDFSNAFEADRSEERRVGKEC